MARKSARHYRGACTGRALWHNDISKASDQRIQDAFMRSSGHRRNILYRRPTTPGWR